MVVIEEYRIVVVIPSKIDTFCPAVRAGIGRRCFTRRSPDLPGTKSKCRPPALPKWEDLLHCRDTACRVSTTSSRCGRGLGLGRMVFSCFMVLSANGHG